MYPSDECKKCGQDLDLYIYDSENYYGEGGYSSIVVDYCPNCGKKVE